MNSNNATIADMLGMVRVHADQRYTHEYMLPCDAADIEYDCPKCGCNRGNHDVSKRNRLIPCESDGEGDDDKEEEDFYKNYGVLAIGYKDEQEDIGFFYTIEEAIVEYKKVSLIDYMRVVIFESENYNPAEGGEFIIVKSRTKKVKKQIKLKLKK